MIVKISTMKEFEKLLKDELFQGYVFYKNRKCLIGLQRVNVFKNNKKEQKQKIKILNRNKYFYSIKNGLCGYCHKRKLKSKTRCKKCLEYQRKIQQKYVKMRR